MSIETSMVVNFSEAKEDSGLRDMLILTQEDWIDNIGKVRMSDFYNFTHNVLLSNTISNDIDCGLNSDGSCTSIIYAYPRVSDLSYQLHTSYGELYERIVDSYAHQELISFDISKESDLTFTPVGNVSYSWLGSVYDSFGNVVSPPSLVIDSNGKVSLFSKVYGTLKVEYQVTQHKYSLKVTRRDTGTDLFGAVVYGVYDQGISWLELDNPPNLDELLEGTMNCGGFSVEDPEDGDDAGSPPTKAPKVDRVITTDYCSQLVLSDVVTYI